MSTELPDPLYRSIIEYAPDAIMFADREGLIRIWNHGAEEIFGYTAAEALGQSLDLIIPEKLRGRHWEGYWRVMATGVSRYGARELLAVPALRKSGEPLSVEFSIVMPPDPEGRPLGVAAILRDVTARWQKERELKVKLAALEAARG